MAIYSLGLGSTITTLAAPSLDVLATSVNSPKVMEYGVNIGAATASVYGIGRPGNDGSQTQNPGVAVLAENPGDPTGQTKLAVAWTTAPTVPTTFLRRIYLPATIGAGVIWTMPRGMTLPVSKGIVNWNIAASSALLHIWFVADE